MFGISYRRMIAAAPLVEASFVSDFLFAPKAGVGRLVVDRLDARILTPTS